MENKKKQFIYIGVVIVCLGAIAWIWFGGGAGRATPPPVPAILNPLVSMSDSSDALPYGTDFDLKLFEDERFSRLVPFRPLLVAPEELGRSNPFAKPGTDLATPEFLPVAFESVAYADSAIGFRLFYPKGWTVEEEPPLGLLVSFDSPFTEQVGSLLVRANIVVSPPAPAEEANIDQAAEEAKLALSSVLNDFSLVNERTVSLKSGLPAKFFEVRHKLGYEVQQFLLVTVRSGQIYTITGTAPAFKWDSYKNVLEASLLTLEFTK